MLMHKTRHHSRAASSDWPIRAIPPLLLAAALVTGCGREGEPAGDKEPDRATQRAGAEAAEGLPRVDGAGLEQIIEEHARQERVLVMDFWATWCIPCIEMFPDLHAGVEALGDRASIVSITLDDPTREEAAIAFLRKHHALGSARMLVPDADRRLAAVETVGREWTDLVVPAVLVYDSRGRLAHEFLGQTDPATIVAAAAALVPGEKTRDTRHADE
jgi:thiol-disulfide isomerase/thioredoxin